jgi:hypothetical protein
MSVLRSSMSDMMLRLESLYDWLGLRYLFRGLEMYQSRWDLKDFVKRGFIGESFHSDLWGEGEWRGVEDSKQ